MGINWLCGSSPENVLGIPNNINSSCEKNFQGHHIAPCHMCFNAFAGETELSLHTEKTKGYK